MYCWKLVFEKVFLGAKGFVVLNFVIAWRLNLNVFLCIKSLVAWLRCQVSHNVSSDAPLPGHCATGAQLVLWCHLSEPEPAMLQLWTLSMQQPLDERYHNKMAPILATTVVAAVWPGAVMTLAPLLLVTFRTPVDHADMRNNFYCKIRFYHIHLNMSFSKYRNTAST